MKSLPFLTLLPQLPPPSYHIHQSSSAPSVTQLQPCSSLSGSARIQNSPILQPTPFFANVPANIYLISQYNCDLYYSTQYICVPASPRPCSTLTLAFTAAYNVILVEKLSFRILRKSRLIPNGCSL